MGIFEKFIRSVLDLPKRIPISLPPYFQNRPYIQGVSWAIGGIVEEGRSGVEVMGKVWDGDGGKAGELSDFARGAVYGVYLVTRKRNDLSHLRAAKFPTVPPFWSLPGHRKTTIPIHPQSRQSPFK